MPGLHAVTLALPGSDVSENFTVEIKNSASGST
jgi:hypothetical protein